MIRRALKFNAGKKEYSTNEWMDSNVREVILYAIMYQNKSHMEKILNIKQSLF